ncbi:MAG TPA: hypothetical protein VGR31_13935 [Planctomycetota bacterium]|jgi:hypothetical protein|nr:hypothetical protein [Planctomycetota bacterium]
MTFLRIVRACAALVVFAQLSATRGLAQCDEWKSGFELSGVDGEVRSIVDFDDGAGPALYIGGTFTIAGGVSAQHVARWDGTAWSPLGSGLLGTSYPTVNALIVFDDGSGPALYAAGSFNTAGGTPASNIAKWNGAGWSALGGGLSDVAYALAVYDDGAGRALYVGGSFVDAGGVHVWNVARWDGATWQALQHGTNGRVYALATFDDGSGPKLYVGGEFYQINGTPFDKIAAWDGTSWSPLGLGVGGNPNAPFDPVICLAVFDDGSGPALFAGGNFHSAGGAPASNVARWDGVAWSALGAGTDNAVVALHVHDDGSGLALIVGGIFEHAGGLLANNVAKWTASGWSTLGSGFFPFASVRALGVFDAGTGPELYAGGSLVSSDGVAINNVGVFRAAHWRAVSPGDGIGGIGSPVVNALIVHDDGSGPGLYAGGLFESAGGTTSRGVAKWNGSSWSALGSGVGGAGDEVRALAYLPSGPTPGLYAGGRLVSLGQIARWDGSNWSTVGGGVSGSQPNAVNALTILGGTLYVAGHFAMAGCNNIAAWTGSNWSALGSGVGGGSVRALAVHDDGSGPAVFAGGDFTTAGGAAAASIARWRGSAWSPLSTGVSGPVRALAVFDDGGGAALYVGGLFATAGGTPASNIAKWDGSNWAPLGSGVDAEVDTLTVWDDGNGPALIAGGSFTSAGGASSVNHIARWNGVVWSSLGSGLDGSAVVVRSYDAGVAGGASLFAGGRFHYAGGIASARIAEYGRCAPGAPFCFGDGTVGPCPCGNEGATGRGCQNSASTGGARLDSAGTTSPDTLVLQVSGEMPTALTVFAQGDAAISPLHFGDGLRCVGGNLKRLYVKSAVGGAAFAPGSGDLSVTARSAALGDTIHPGDTRFYLAYYRDPDPAFCSTPAGNSFNASNAISIVW